MSRFHQSTLPCRMQRAAGIAALLALGACASALTGPRSEEPPDSLTVQRIQGRAAEVRPLLPAEGNVWPAAELESPRATLGSPDLMDRQSPDNPPPANRPIPRGSSTPPDLLDRRTNDDFSGRPQSPPPSLSPLPQSQDFSRPGRVIPTPDGSVVTTGGNQGYSTYSGPNGRSGTAIQQGNTMILMDADGRVQQVPVPR
ncbi:hypothetical protein [Teichococcus oryzae]|uniref:Uncharacterized protein n=1 Tax=Teichococcus oryzae TaxID=1608942 RepID=A0A5B2TDV0_9PROT|nr:hypothetical protein [Pseudoroseomonas oryzae]KAA2212283.1 hypothetical protein F0Q34_15790 [Pseudoroseomonas oryzae]